MARGLAFRRWQAQQAKRRAWQYLHVWWGIDHPRPGHVGVFASTHCRPCSCYICSRGRRYHGVPYQEQVNLFSMREQMREAGVR